MLYDILMLSRLVPKEISLDTKAKVRNLMDEASFAWQYHLVEGMEMCGEMVQLANIMPISTYPNGYASRFVKREIFSHNGITKDVNVSMCNIKFLKRLFLYSSLKKEVKRWAKSDSGNRKVLLVYTLYPEFLKIVGFIKKRYKNIVVLGVVLDLPEFAALHNYRKSFLYRLYERYNAKLVKNNINKIDGLIPITEQMVEALHFKNKYAVIEGIATSSFPTVSLQNDKKVIIYAGMLHEKFGLIKLLNAFDLIKDDDMQLVICGVGEAETEIRVRAAKDRRIDFKGQLPREKVLELMVNAHLIVNPRFKKECYTKYSFPSKNIEALSSGVPFVGYKLEGIPDEYDAFINYPIDDTDESLALLIKNVCDDKQQLYKQKAALAKEWINLHKNKAAQGKRVLDLVSEVMSEGENHSKKTE